MFLYQVAKNLPIPFEDRIRTLNVREPHMPVGEDVTPRLLVSFIEFERV
jgi:hypothetical protein